MLSNAGRTPWLIVVLSLGTGGAVADTGDAAKIPTREEVKAILDREPLNQQSWPAWRERLLSWMGDRSQRTEAAF
jgi:hypothetical protein